ncbi:DsbA family protein [Miltoncostaea marina]|uniref:DsbA family protein n=1 Tax=Miltoncostaea marina TaxID=2843215 RepID=UPI001C3CF9A2|nr:DsbA family protein [Miltoncostaea marina]
MRTRYTWIAVAVAAVIVAVLVGTSLSGGGEDEGGDEAAAAILGAQSVESELSGLRQSGNELGDPDAPVEIVEYGDLACPHCKEAAESMIPDVISQLVRTGEARLVFRPIAFISPSSERGALGAEAAAEQDAMWSLVTLLYRNQGDERADWLSDELLEQAVGELGLDVEAWRTDYRSSQIERRAAERAAAAEADGVEGTPTFIVRGPGGERMLQGVVGVTEVAEAVAAVGPS